MNKEFNMKPIINLFMLVMIMVFIMVIIAIGVTFKKHDYDKNNIVITDDRFSIVDVDETISGEYKFPYKVVIDGETNVEYIITEQGISPILNDDGTPRIYNMGE